MASELFLDAFERTVAEHPNAIAVEEIGGRRYGVAGFAIHAEASTRQITSSFVTNPCRTYRRQP